MRKTVANLVDAARGLRLARHPGTHGLRIGSPPAELPVRLLALLEAIEALDAEGANASVLDADPAQVAAGIDGIFRWIAAQGLSTDDPLAILAKAIGKAPKSEKKLIPLPRFAPGFKPKGSWKPKLTLGLGIGSVHGTTIESLMESGRNMDETARLMGKGAATQAPAAEEPAPLSMGPC